MEVAEAFEGYEISTLMLTKVGSNRIDIGKSLVFQCEHVEIFKHVQKKNRKLSYSTYIHMTLRGLMELREHLRLKAPYLI